MKKAVATAVETAERSAGQLRCSRSSRTLTSVERLHRRLLDVIKDASIAAAWPISIRCSAVVIEHRRQGIDRGRAAHARLLSRLQRLLQSEEARRARLPRPSAFSRVDRRSVRIRLTPQGQEIRKIVDALYQKHVKTLEQVGGIRTRSSRPWRSRCTGLSGSGPTRSCIGSENYIAFSSEAAFRFA